MCTYLVERVEPRRVGGWGRRVRERNERGSTRWYPLRDVGTRPAIKRANSQELAQRKNKKRTITITWRRRRERYEEVITNHYKQNRTRKLRSLWRVTEDFNNQALPSSFSMLLSLPPELLLHIISYIPPREILLTLSILHSDLYHLLSASPSSLLLYPNTWKLFSTDHIRESRYGFMIFFLFF